MPPSPHPPLLSHSRPTADYSSSGACALGMERGGPGCSACMDAKTLKAYSITVTLPLFVASVAHDRRTASADGYPSLLPSLPHSTTVEQPAALFYPAPQSHLILWQKTASKKPGPDVLRQIPMPAFSGHVSSFPYQYLAISSVPPLRVATTHALQTSPLPTTTLFPLSTAPTPTLLNIFSTPPTTASPRPRWTS